MKKKAKNLEPRKIDILAKEKFDGDIRKTIDYLLKEQPADLRNYTAEMDSAEATYASNVLYYMAEEEHGEGYMNLLIDLTCTLERLGITQEELAATEYNPHGAQVKQHILIVSAAVVVAGVMLGLAPRFIENETITTWIGVMASAVTTWKAVGLAGHIMAYVNFARAKKLLKKKTELKNGK